jgi:cell division septation protein DedD
VKPKPKPADTTPSPRTADAAASPNGSPLSITPQGHHRRTVVASAEPETSPREAAANESNVARGESCFSIQLASSPSESDARATLSRLQKQFPNMLGGGSIRRANLGNKGIYYRVRVGPLSRDAADKLCSQIKAGGADCILTRG